MLLIRCLYRMFADVQDPSQQTIAIYNQLIFPFVQISSAGGQSATVGSCRCDV